MHISLLLLLLTGLFVVLWAAPTNHGKRLENEFEAQFQSIQDGANPDYLEPVEVAPPFKPEGLNKVSSAHHAHFTLQRGTDAQEGMMPAPMPEGAPQNGAVEDQPSFQHLAVSKPENEAAAMAVADDMAANQAQARAQTQAQTVSRAQTPPVVSQEATVHQASMSGNGFNHHQPSNGHPGQENGQQRRAFNEIIRPVTDLVHRQRRETAGNTSQDGSRRRRDTEAECLEDQYLDGDKCTACFCAAGKQSTAEFCGYGIIRGEPGCEPCPDDTYRNGTDNSIHCHPCSVCDPDATITLNCTKIQDTLCACKEGFVRRDTHCVSCRDHPDEEGCPPATTPGIPPETSLETSPEPSQEIPKDESKKPDSRYIIAWKVGLIIFACSGVSIIIGILAGIPIYKIYISRTQSRGNQGTSGEGGEGGIDMKEQRNGHAVDDQGPRDDPDAQHPPTENRESVANEEANGLLEANGGGVTS